MEHELWLDHEPSFEEVIKSVDWSKKYKQFVFCGYGEPLLRVEMVIEIAKYIRSKYPQSNPNSPKIRIDTNGHANIFHGRNILPELKGLIDIISISLNAEEATTYDSICNSFFGVAAHAAVIDFIKEAKNYIPQVEASVVDLPKAVDIEKARKIAEEIGVSFRVRPYYEDKYKK